MRPPALTPQLKRDPLGSMLNKAEDSQISPLHRTRLIIRAGLLAMWTVGVVVAIRSGWDPGPWWDKSLQQWHYPLRQVLIEIAKITLISLGLYDVLRPRPDTSSFGRTVGDVLNSL